MDRERARERLAPETAEEREVRLARRRVRDRATRPVESGETEQAETAEEREARSEARLARRRVDRERARECYNAHHILTDGSRSPIMFNISTSKLFISRQ